MKTLEAYKAFTYVAWLSVVLFSLFTYKLVLDLKQSVENLNAISNQQQAMMLESNQGAVVTLP